MLKIYISSTYEDLRNERDAVRGAISQCNHHPVGMEDDVASERRPIEVCLERLRECQLYIGIIAWRYGYIEPKIGKSMTEIEYEEAGNAGIPRLMFLASPKALWNPQWVDRTPELIRFRERIEQDRYRREFEQPDGLRAEVIAAIHQFEKSAEAPSDAGRQGDRSLSVSAPSPPSDSLIGLIDRGDQDDEIQLASRKSSGRPQVFVLHGGDKESLEDYLERVRNRTLGKSLGSVQHFEINWPGLGRSQADFNERLTLRIVERVSDQAEAFDHVFDTEELNRILANQGRNVMLSVVLLSRQDIGANYRDILAYFADYWKQWPTLQPGHRLLVFLCIKYELGVVKKSWFSQWWERNQTAEQINEAIQKHLDAIEQEPESGMKIIPQLSPIRRTDCDAWLRLTEVQQVVQDRARLRRLIREFFNDLESKSRSIEPSLPMEEMVGEIRNWFTPGYEI